MVNPFYSLKYTGSSYDLYFTIEDLAVISYLQKKFHTLYISITLLINEIYNSFRTMDTSD